MFAIILNSSPLTSECSCASPPPPPQEKVKEKKTFLMEKTNKHIYTTLLCYHFEHFAPDQPVSLLANIRKKVNLTKNSLKPKLLHLVVMLCNYFEQFAPDQPVSVLAYKMRSILHERDGYRATFDRQAFLTITLFKAVMSNKVKIVLRKKGNYFYTKTSVRQKGKIIWQKISSYRSVLPKV